MPTMSATRIRSLYRRHDQAHKLFLLFRELRTSICHRVLSNPSHRSLAGAFRRRTLPRRSSPGDGEGRARLTHHFASLLNFKFTSE